MRSRKGRGFGCELEAVQLVARLVLCLNTAKCHFWIVRRRCGIFLHILAETLTPTRPWPTGDCANHDILLLANFLGFPCSQALRAIAIYLSRFPLTLCLSFRR